MFHLGHLITRLFKGNWREFRGIKNDEEAVGINTSKDFKQLNMYSLTEQQLSGDVTVVKCLISREGMCFSEELRVPF